MSISVFISHSTAPGSDDAAFRDLLCQRLRKKKIEVVIDKSIPVAHTWRDFLFGGMVSCRAAIVLANEQALERSSWVNTEVSVLGCRAFCEKKDFCLIVIPLGKITGKDIARHAAWEPVAVSEYQMLPSEGLDPAKPKAVDEIIQKVIETLVQLPDISDLASAQGWLVSRLCGLLEYEPKHLYELGKVLGTDVQKSQHAELLRYRVAKALYQKGPAALWSLLRYPHSRLARQELQCILSILETHWIDMNASARILLSCRKDIKQAAFAINGKMLGFSPRAYIRQVCDLLDPWLIITVSTKSSAAGIVEQIRQTCLQNYGSLIEVEHPDLNGMRPVEQDRCINAFLESFLETPNGESPTPMFVALRQEGGGNVSDILTAVHEAFPSIRIIVCTGTEPGKAVLCSKLHMLEPEFPLDAEQTAWDATKRISAELLKMK